MILNKFPRRIFPNDFTLFITPIGSVHCCADLGSLSPFACFVLISYCPGYIQIMKSLWCSKKNTIIELMKDPEKFNNALIPCKGSGCDRWKDGQCLHINERRKKNSK
jgi:hypothetical protein